MRPKEYPVMLSENEQAGVRHLSRAGSHKARTFLSRLVHESRAAYPLHSARYERPEHKRGIHHEILFR
jgi:hypothetical protein